MKQEQQQHIDTRFKSSWVIVPSPASSLVAVAKLHMCWQTEKQSSFTHTYKKKKKENRYAFSDKDSSLMILT